MRLVVQKFGGTSVADAEKIHRAARRAVKAKLDGSEVVMVVSAMGKTTDQLIALAREVHPTPPRREMDMLLSTGEQISISLMAMAIASAGQQAISLTAAQVGLVTDEAHTKARIKSIDADRIRRHLDAGQIVIVAGFQGVTEAGEITTLGRGASDTTAVALAAVLGAERCEIYTDVDGIYTADPRLVPQARKMNGICYDEMLELASLGAGVMHSRAIEFGKKYGVPIHVRSSLTDTEGTMIVEEHEAMEQVIVRGATVKRDLVRVTLMGVPNVPGSAAQIFAKLAGQNVIVDDIIQNVYEHGKVANIGFTVPTADLNETRALVELIGKELPLEGYEIDENVAKVSIVGIGMRSHAGVAEKMFEALATGKINIENISTSEIMIGCLVRADQADLALRLVHETFELDKAPATGEPQ